QSRGRSATPPPQTPGRITSRGLVSPAVFPVASPAARRCGAFTTYRRVSFSPVSTISGMHSGARRATAHRDLKELAALLIQCLLFQFMRLFGNRSPLSALPFFLSQQPFG